MPIYEYKCGTCGQVFEIKQSFSDATLTTHDNCGGPVHRIISAPALQFKGTGWYITDYAKSGAGSKNPKGGGDTDPSSKPKSDTPAASPAPSPSSTETKK